MPQILENNFDDVLNRLEPWSETATVSGQGLFICTVGFEDRTASCFEEWAKACTHSDAEVLFVKYPTNESDNLLQEAILLEIAVRHSIRRRTITYERHSFFGQLVAYLGAQSKVSKVTLDISTISSYVIFPMFEALCSTTNDWFLEIAYAEAIDYFPTKNEWDDFQADIRGVEDLLERARLFEERHFQSKGIEETYESPLFPGMNRDRLQTQLVVIPNFSYERVQKMIAYCDDRYATGREQVEYEWLFGTPPDQPKNGWRCEALMDMYARPKNQYPVSTLNYKDIQKTLHELWRKYRFSRSLIIATCGSKAQHVGTFLFLKAHPEVSLVLSEPIEFTASRFSSGTRKRWYLKVGNISELKSTIGAWNQMEFKW